MVNSEFLPQSIAPDHPSLTFSGFVELTRGPDSAFAVRPAGNTLYSVDAPGAVIQFRLKASAAEAIIDYTPKAELAGRIHYHSAGVVLMDGTRNAAFTRPANGGGEVRIPLAPGDDQPHTWDLVFPYADVVKFRGLRISADGQLFSLPTEVKPHYVACGDSITHGFLAGDAPSGYAWQLAKKMGWRLTNLGFGSRTAVPDDARMAAALSPDVVTILLGVNDCLGKIPIAAFTQNYGAFLDILLQARPAARIVVITPLSVPGQWEGIEPLEDYRAALRGLVGERPNSNLVLVEGPALIPPDLSLFADGLHPNDKGFAVMAERLSLLQNLPAKTASNASIVNGGSRLIKNLAAGQPQVAVAFGTSLTAGNDWVAQLRDWLNSEYPGKLTLINSGIGGSSSRNSNPALSGLDQLQAKVLDHNPDTVFIEFAINDSYTPYGPLTLQQSRDNLNTMIDRILARNPQAEIILQTMNPVWDEPTHGYKAPSLHPDIAAYYQGYLNVAAKRGLLLIDHYPNWKSLSENDPARFESYIPDGVHPNGDGYRAVVLPVLKQRLSEKL